MPQPLFLEPVYKDYIWGADRLKTLFGKRTDLFPLAESWELCCHRDGVNVILNGPFASRTLAEYLESNPRAVSLERERRGLPLLVKYIDAREPLSIQVHPDDEYARRVEGEANGKAEIWYVLDCEPDSSLLCGVNESVTRGELQSAARKGEIERLLRRVTVKRGDVFRIMPGTLHSIGAGIVIAEIQHNSNLTYRVWDYGRKSAGGEPRELHIDKALDVARLEPDESAFGAHEPPQERGGYAETVIERGGLFDVRLIDVKISAPLALARESFTHIMATSGSGALVCDGEIYPLKTGDSVFIPAGVGAAEITGGVCALVTRPGARLV